MNNYYVYSLIDPRKQETQSYCGFSFLFQPFYIGMGKKGRLLDHFKPKFLNRDKNNHKKYKILHILELGYTPETLAIKLKDNITREEAISLEIRLIKEIGRSSLDTGPLTNLTDGGDGTVGFPITPEFRTKMSRIVSGIKRTEEAREHYRLSKLGNKNPQYGISYSKYKRRKMSKASIGKINIKVYKLIGPDSKIHITNKGMTQFCKEHNLQQACMSLLIHNKLKKKNHRGWKYLETIK